MFLKFISINLMVCIYLLDLLLRCVVELGKEDTHQSRQQVWVSTLQPRKVTGPELSVNMCHNNVSRTFYE